MCCSNKIYQVVSSTCGCSQIIVNGKFIPFNKVSVHKVLGTPIGGDSLSVDCEVGKTFILSRFNLSTLPPIRFFGDKIKNKQL